MLIQLEPEVWMQVLGWFKRRELAQLLNQLPVADRQFTKIVQDYLHEYTRNVSIGRLSIDGNSLRLLLKQVPIAQVELPENITNFKSIAISHEVHPPAPAMLALLRRMQPLFRNHSLYLYHHGFVLPMEYQSSLRLLMPVIKDNQIESINLDGPFLQFASANYPASLFIAKVLKINNFSNYHDVNYHATLINWLFAQREDGQPRTLVLYNYYENTGLLGRICEQFTDPTRHLASPFFVRIDANPLYPDELLPMPLTIENARTEEQLSIERVQRGDKIYGLITNHRPLISVVDPEWLANRKAEVLDSGNNDDNQQRSISILFPI